MSGYTDLAHPSREGDRRRNGIIISFLLMSLFRERHERWMTNLVQYGSSIPRREDGSQQHAARDIKASSLPQEEEEEGTTLV